MPDRRPPPAVVSDSFGDSMFGMFGSRKVNPPQWYLDHRDAQFRRRQ
jgi:hypothetical protein